MKTIYGDLFAQSCDAICIPTNGWVNGRGHLVMGAGVAKQAAKKFPHLMGQLGGRVRYGGHRVIIATQRPDHKTNKAPQSIGSGPAPYHVVSFPTKPTRIYVAEGLDAIMPRYREESESQVYVPGWKGYSRIGIIRHSVDELIEISDLWEWKKVCLPAVGCGHGGLPWSEVKEALSKLDDRFTVVLRKE